MVSASEMKDVGSVSNQEKSILDYEFIMRGVLESARKVKGIAEKHLQSKAEKLTLIVSRNGRILCLGSDFILQTVEMLSNLFKN